MSSERSARHVQIGSARPLISTGPASSTSTVPAASRRTAGPSTISPGAGGLLEARGDVHGLAGRERGRRGVVDDDLAGLDADARLEAQRVHFVHHGERRAQRALGVVLVRARHAERRHHRVAGELLDRAAVLLDAGRCLVEVLAHAPAHDLGIDGPDERGRVDQIDEEHGRELPFHPSNCRRPAAGGRRARAVSAR